MMANYGRGWNDGYGGQSAKAIAAYDAQCEREAAQLASRKPYDFAADLERRLKAGLAKMFSDTGLSEKEIFDRATQLLKRRGLKVVRK